MTTPASTPTAGGFGTALRGWRRHRRLSQLALSLEAGVSPRHVSFLETGRSRPSRAVEVRQGDATLRWLTTLITFGGALDVAVDELVVECFFPADVETERLIAASAR